MKYFRCSLLILFLLPLVPRMGAGQVTTSGPILFVTQVPTPQDSATVTSLFGNHGGDMQDAPRGGDLWIRYSDGSLKNLTRAAGFGVDGRQGSGAIAVREPSVHWSGTRALFSMVVGGAAQQGDRAEFYWQIYEITGFGKNETPVITRVPNQPDSFNNVSPIYGTDDRIIFTSDRTRTGERHLYPALDEYKGTHTNTGLWSLDPVSGDLLQLDNSPSGDFSPTIDSYGRVLVMRWDRLQRDRNADMDALGTGVKGTFNYADESAGAVPQYGVRDEYFPEPQGSRTDLLNGTNMLGFEFNQFFPWQINEDGTAPETLNHLGRHEMRQQFNRAVSDDSNVVIFNYATSGRQNQNPIINLMQVREDPRNPGTYYGIDAQQVQTHSGGQIIAITAAPTLDPDQTVVTYVTHRATESVTPEGGTPNPNHSGFYRNPIVLTDGTLIAAHSVDTHADRNLGTRSGPVSRFAYRLVTMKKASSVWSADQTLTGGISRSVTYWDPDSLVQFSGELWELDPVEVRVRERPERRVSVLPSQESQIMAGEGVSEAAFRAYLVRNDLAVAVTRDVTHRDGMDRQQPYYLRIAGTGKQTPNAVGKIYDVSYLQFFQGDYVRGQGLTSPTAVPHAGRRILAVPMHQAIDHNPPGGGPAGAAKLGADGSMASFVPARHAVTWQLVSPAGVPVVRERYWVTFQPGEIRVCASCHGTNDAATTPLNPIPQNRPEAFRELLRAWKRDVLPSHATLISPQNGSSGVAPAGDLRWQLDPKATSWRVQLARDSTFATTLIDRSAVAGDTAGFTGLAAGATYYWRVRGSSEYGDGDWSETWRFRIAGMTGVEAVPGSTAGALSISGYPDPFAVITTIAYTTRGAGRTRITLYDACGIEVSRLHDESEAAGTHLLYLDLDRAGLDLPAGIYFVRLESAGGTAEAALHVVR